MPLPFDDEVTTVPRRQTARPLSSACFLVSIVSGEGAGSSVSVDANRTSRLLVGTSPACELRLVDCHASRRHLAIELRGGRLSVEDLGSTNGTFAGPVQIQKATLGGGERLTVGGTVLAIERTDDAVADPAETASFGRVVGRSPEMRRLYPLCQAVAMSDAPVVVEGEVGTGKELMAEALHEAGPRAQGPFVVFDSTAIAPARVEGALFGHEGASVGGFLEQAAGGTLLIDEIGNLDALLQARLVEVLKSGQARRLGADVPFPVIARIIATSRLDLDREVQESRFSEQLLLCLGTTRIELPPLRNREGDTTVLIRHFWELLGGEGLPPEDLRLRIAGHHFPGNVRELRDEVARRVALGPDASGVGGRASTPPGHGEDVIERVLAQRLSLTRARDVVSSELERRYLESVLAENGGNVVRAAQAAGVARRYFQLLRAKHRGSGG
jgi:DNA-binding NtrC family response regulator